MLKPREKFIVAAVPIGIFLIAVWGLWLSPRLVFHEIADGSWSDFSSVRHTRAGDETVISFRARSNDALLSLVDRLEFRRGIPGGNVDEISEAALRSEGYDPGRFEKYFSSARLLLFLYVDSDECVMVRINL